MTERSGRTTSWTWFRSDRAGANSPGMASATVYDLDSLSDALDADASSARARRSSLEDLRLPYRPLENATGLLRRCSSLADGFDGAAGDSSEEEGSSTSDVCSLPASKPCWVVLRCLQAGTFRRPPSSRRSSGRSSVCCETKPERRSSEAATVRYHHRRPLQRNRRLVRESCALCLAALDSTERRHRSTLSASVLSVAKQTAG